MSKRLYEQCCRLCLYSGIEVGLVDVFSVPKLNSLILELYNIEVTPNDGSTTRVCSVCLKDTLDFNALTKQYDRDRTHVLEINAKILEKVQAAIPTASAGSKATEDSTTKENRTSKESIQTANKETASGNVKKSNEAPRVAQRQQQVRTESPRQTPSKTSDSRMSAAESRATGSREASNDKASKGSNVKDKDKDKNKDGNCRSSHNQADQSATKPKNSAKGLGQRPINKPGLARSENRPSESANSTRGSKETTMSYAKTNDPCQRPSSPKSKRANERIGSGENRASTSGESSNKSKDSLKRSSEGREPTKSKNTDHTRSESSAKSGSSKPSEKPPDKKQSSSNVDYRRKKESNSSNKKTNVDQSLRPLLIPENSSAKETAASKDSASNQGQINIINGGSENPRATEHSTFPHSNNAIVRTYDGANKNKRTMTSEKSDRRESTSKPSTSGTIVRFAEGTSGMSSNETPNLEVDATNRKRGPGAPLKLPRIKIRLLNRADHPLPLIEVIPSSNATTTDPRTSTVSTTAPTMCTSLTTMETTSSPSSQIVATSPVVQSRVSELQASKPGIPKRRHSVYNHSLIRISSNLFDSSKESEEFAAIRNNTMLRLDALKNRPIAPRPIASRPMQQAVSQIPSNAGIDHSSALVPAVPNGAAENFALQPQTSVTDADNLRRGGAQKTITQRRKSVCVANFRQIQEQSSQSDTTNDQTRMFPYTLIPVNNIAAMSGQLRVQNNGPIIATSTNYGPNMISCGNSTVARVSLNVQPTSAAAPVPALRFTLGNNTIPVHVVSQNAPVSTAAGFVTNNAGRVSYTNAIAGSIASLNPTTAMPSLDPRTSQNILQPQRTQMPVLEHSYSIN